MVGREAPAAASHASNRSSVKAFAATSPATFESATGADTPDSVSAARRRTVIRARRQAATPPSDGSGLSSYWQEL
jgi:hypothetical protein